MKPTCSSARWLLAGALLISIASLPAAETDDRIEAAAKSSHVFKTYLKDDAIKTVSKDGVVTLTGTVAQESHRELAQDTVAGLPGVKSVDNQLMVEEEAPAELSDTWIGVKVKTALLFHRNVRATKTVINVRDGVVILTGEASSEAQKELTTEYARDVEGVKEVKNEMTVVTDPAPPARTAVEKIDDASITAHVKSTLRAHYSTSKLNPKIATMAGVVTLSGAVKNAAQKSLVTKLVSDVEGVVSVTNNLTVETAVSLLPAAPGTVQNLRIVGN
ncbi:MAG TPA: BON domain-containing protein [Verrucomicrobiae bacterium]|nr:BON domain-containing protein [Verrucomicrobiae bacterium]